ncbi:MAG: T9SS type A sorting domain-containing protein [Bacteroidales bacterium]|nr:T9SS type A sorting domain-containing protein [Bacteroidales bacterium]
MKFFYILSFLLICKLVTGQQHVPLWNFFNNGSVENRIVDMQQGKNLCYVTGVFSDSLVVDTVKLYSAGKTDAFFLALSPNGKPAWIKQIGSTGDDASLGMSVSDSLLLIAYKIGDTSQAPKIRPIDQFFIGAFTPGGEPLWELPIQTSGNASLDLLVQASGGVFMAGGSFDGIISLAGKDFTADDGTKAYSVFVTSGGIVAEGSATEGKGNHRMVAGCFDHNGNPYRLLALSDHSSFVTKSSEIRNITFPKEGLVIVKGNLDSPDWVIPVRCQGYVEGVALFCNKNGHLFAGFNYNYTLSIDNKQLSTSKALVPLVTEISPYGQILDVSQVNNYPYCRMLDFKVGSGGTLLLGGYQHGGFVDDADTSTLGDSWCRSTFVAEVDKSSGIVWHEELVDNENVAKSLIFNNDGTLYLAGAYRTEPADASTKSVRKQATTSGVYVRTWHYCRPKEALLPSGLTICRGDTLTLSPPEGFAEYRWNDTVVTSNTFLITNPGLIKLRVKDGFGCLSKDSVMVSLKPDARANLGADTTIACGQSILISVDSSTTGFAWSDGYTSRSRIVSGGSSGSSMVLSVTVKSDGFCPASESITIGFADTLPDSDQGFSVFPNPAREKLNWWFDDGTDNPFILNIIDQGGTTVFSSDHSSLDKAKIHTLNLTAFSNGSYIVKVRCGNQMKSTTIVKQ